MSTTPVAEAPAAAPVPAVKRRRLHAAKEQMSSKAWQLTTIIVPILLTSWLTYFVSQKQSKTEDRINSQSQMLSQQLQQQMQLSEELYKRRFDAYDKLYTELVQFDEKLARVDAANGDNITAEEAIQLNEILDTSGLHMSRYVADLAFDTWLATSRGQRDPIEKSIDKLKDGMKSEIDWKTETIRRTATDSAKEATAQENTSSRSAKSKTKTGGSQ